MYSIQAPILVIIVHSIAVNLITSLIYNSKKGAEILLLETYS